MRAERGILLLGMVGLIALIASAVIGDDASIEAPARGETMIAPDRNATPSATPPPTAATVAWARPAALQGVVPFQAAATVRFRGRVQRLWVRGAQSNWEQEHILIASGVIGGSQEISLAPRWFLAYMGCTITPGMMVRGVAFDFNRRSQADPNHLLYAKRITANGTTCHLRNDEGLALWSNKLSAQNEAAR